MTWITLSPWTRVNDQFVRSDRIDAHTPCGKISHPLIDTLPNNGKLQESFYKNIALDIVTESVFHYPYPFISEKTFRPIACKRMFLLVAPAGTLAALKSRGFRSFDDIIDESYDEIQDPEQRFLKIVSEIDRFCQMPLEDIKSYYRDHRDLFDYNFDILSSIIDDEHQIIKRRFEPDTQ